MKIYLIDYLAHSTKTAKQLFITIYKHALGDDGG